MAMNSTEDKQITEAQKVKAAEDARAKLFEQKKRNNNSAGKKVPGKPGVRSK